MSGGRCDTELDKELKCIRSSQCSVVTWPSLAGVTTLEQVNGNVCRMYVVSTRSSVVGMRSIGLVSED